MSPIIQGKLFRIIENRVGSKETARMVRFARHSTFGVSQDRSQALERFLLKSERPCTLLKSASMRSEKALVLSVVVRVLPVLPESSDRALAALAKKPGSPAGWAFPWVVAEQGKDSSLQEPNTGDAIHLSSATIGTGMFGQCFTRS
jgi:hypothetical protein